MNSISENTVMGNVDCVNKGKLALNDISPAVLNQVKFEGGKLSIPQAFIDTVRAAEPSVDLSAAVNKYTAWCSSLAQGTGGQPGKTLLRFIENEAARGEMPVAATTGKGTKVRTVAPQGENADRVNRINGEIVRRACLEAGVDPSAYEQTFGVDMRQPAQLQINTTVDALVALPVVEPNFVVVPDAESVHEKVVPADEYEYKLEAELYVTETSSQKPKAKKTGKTVDKAIAVKWHEQQQGIVRYDRGLGSSELFYHVPKGKDRVFRQNIPVQHFNGFNIKLTAPEMDETDQLLLLTYMFLAGQQPVDKLNLEAGSIDKKLIADKFQVISVAGKQVANAALKKPTCLVQTSLSKLLKIMRFEDTGPNRKAIKAAHERLCATLIEVEHPESGDFFITSFHPET